MFSKSSTLSSNGVIFWSAFHTMTSMTSCIVTSGVVLMKIFINNQLIIIPIGPHFQKDDLDELNNHLLLYSVLQYNHNAQSIIKC